MGAAVYWRDNVLCKHSLPKLLLKLAMASCVSKHGHSFILGLWLAVDRVCIMWKMF